MNKYRLEPAEDNYYYLQRWDGEKYNTCCRCSGEPQARSYIKQLDRPMIEIPDPVEEKPPPKPKAKKPAKKKKATKIAELTKPQQVTK